MILKQLLVAMDTMDTTEGMDMIMDMEVMDMEDMDIMDMDIVDMVITMDMGMDMDMVDMGMVDMDMVMDNKISIATLGPS
jgi:hypothetical protein